jgi:hypothetical protein
MPKPQLTQVQFQQCLNLLGISLVAWQAPLHTADPHAALEDLKKRIKSEWRKALLKYHPDKPGGSEALVKLLNNFMELVDAVNIQRRPDPRPVTLDHGFTSGTTVTVFIKHF